MGHRPPDDVERLRRFRQDVGQRHAGSGAGFSLIPSPTFTVTPLEPADLISPCGPT